MKKITKLFFALALLFLFFITHIMAQDTASYLSPYTPTEKGNAPGMTYKLLSDSNGVKEYVLVFAKGDEVLSGINDFAIQQHIASARFTAIGALKEATIAWFDLNRKSYKLISVHTQVELVSLIGDIALYNGKPVVHTHAGLGFADGSMKGGHLVKGITSPTVELFMTVYTTPLLKEVDQETDLKLMRPDKQ